MCPWKWASVNRTDDTRALETTCRVRTHDCNMTQCHNGDWRGAQKEDDDDKRLACMGTMYVLLLFGLLFAHIQHLLCNHMTSQKSGRNAGPFVHSFVRSWTHMSADKWLGMWKDWTRVGLGLMPTITISKPSKEGRLTWSTFTSGDRNHGDTRSNSCFNWLEGRVFWRIRNEQIKVVLSLKSVWLRKTSTQHIHLSTMPMCTTRKISSNLPFSNCPFDRPRKKKTKVTN